MIYIGENTRTTRTTYFMKKAARILAITLATKTAMKLESSHFTSNPWHPSLAPRLSPLIAL
jgi:hypothetical protein